jgi:hypothetical protein
MISLAKIILYLFEGAAITVAIHLISKKRLHLAELFTLALTIGVTFMILDLFSPSIASGARQGAGFGLGWKQVGGTPRPGGYYGAQGSPCKSGTCKGNLTGGYAEPRGYNPAVNCQGSPLLKAMQPDVYEGMDDKVAIEYYQRYNPPYQRNSLPPPLDTHSIDQGAPRVLENEHFEGTAQPPQASESVGLPASSSQISKKMRENPFQTTVRSSQEIDQTGSYYGPEDPTSARGQTPEAPLLYNPQLPTYGYRAQLPQGWDQLEQPNINKAFNRFRNTVPNSMNCQVGPYGDQGQYNPNYRYGASPQSREKQVPPAQKKNRSF